MNRFGTDFDALVAVAAATLDAQGMLRYANAGFRRLVEPESAATPGTAAAHFLIQPTFAQLLAATPLSTGEVHRGLLTIGIFAGRTCSLRGIVTRDGDQLHVLAEQDLADLERLSQVVLALNRDYAAAQHELAQAYVAQQQLNASLQEQTMQLQASLDRVKRLEGFLSICTYCKKMRAGDDAWQRIEEYLSVHTDAVLSHGACPECAKEQGAIALKALKP